MAVSLKAADFPKEVVLHAVFFHTRWGVSYRNLEEVLAVRGMSLEQGTLNRWEVDTRIWWLKLPDVESAPQIFHEAWMRYLRKV